jgi:hypothetical protein
MKVENTTKYETKNLRKIFALCAARVRRDEGKRWEIGRGVNVKVRYNRGGWWIGGYAYYHSTFVAMKLPRVIEKERKYGKHSLEFSQSVAETFIHELGHCLGVRHKKSGDTIEEWYIDWIKAAISDERYPIGEKVIAKKMIDVKTRRYELARINLAKAETRMKRARTLYAKWLRKVRYYEKALGAPQNQNGENMGG